jgi:hypothetical protein
MIARGTFFRGPRDISGVVTLDLEIKNGVWAGSVQLPPDRNLQDFMNAMLILQTEDGRRLGVIVEGATDVHTRTPTIEFAAGNAG